MSLTSNSMGVSDKSDDRAVIRMSIDLVAVARRHLVFLKTVADSHWLHDTTLLHQSIRRYDELWMPLISGLTTGTTRPILLPPLDVQWVWHCHTLNPASYRNYCQVRFSKILEKPLICDDGNEEYALSRCSDIWSERYPFEPFELQVYCDGNEKEITINHDDIFTEVSRYKDLCYKFSKPYMLEVVYLIAAKQRYKEFMNLAHKFKDTNSRFVPTVAIQLMWLTHKSYPLIYSEDVKGIEGCLEKVVRIWEILKDEDVEGTKRLWEQMFDQPYEKAGATLDGVVGTLKPPVYWVVSDTDVNIKYKSMNPRFVLEVCVFLRRKPVVNPSQDKNNAFLRLGAVRCHRELKIDKTITSLPSDTWTKTWHLYCEFTTRALTLELRHRTSSCLKKPVRSTVTFQWNDLLRAPCLTIGKELGQEVRSVASITPPVQAPYLLKCVPDRVTDDSGAMISDEILKMNRYRPQEGRWLSRTMLDHTGKGCFIVRIRVGSGIWRRGGEIPVAVKWEDRVIEVREGSWSYVAGSIGRAPEKVAGTATPFGQSKEKASWILSTGDELTLQRVSSGFIFNLQNNNSTDSVRLLKGRKMQYEVINEVGNKDEDDAFITLVRYNPGSCNERATALINWRLVAVELLPEEDAVMVLLICMAILRSISEMMGEDMGNMLVRRRLTEHKIGMRDWGSIVMLPSPLGIANSPVSPFLQPWHWNANTVMAPVVEADRMTRQAPLKYPLAEGGDKLYKSGIIPNLK